MIKRLPPQLTNVIHYLVKREILIAHVTPLSCYRNSRIDYHIDCGLQIRQI